MIGWLLCLLCWAGIFLAVLSPEGSFLHWVSLPILLITLPLLTYETVKDKRR